MRGSRIVCAQRVAVRPGGQTGEGANAASAPLRGRHFCLRRLAQDGSVHGPWCGGAQQRPGLPDQALDPRERPGHRRTHLLEPHGFWKVVHIEQGGLVKPERDDTEFQHSCFLRGQEQLLENIKRKVTSVSTLKSEDIKIRQDSVTKLLTDVQLMKGKQECMDSKLLAMKHENEALWREVASLRQKHAQQQKVVNKLIQFLISLVQSNRILGVKRKIPLMLSDSSSKKENLHYNSHIVFKPPSLQ
uniref:HSF-type DNA-binding domain-containing protein n=1 Tax=Sciurus vulgaris TaxID=55149 RepID=A0A8D2CLL6_SCIVU